MTTHFLDFQGLSWWHRVTTSFKSTWCVSPLNFWFFFILLICRQKMQWFLQSIILEISCFRTHHFWEEKHSAISLTVKIFYNNIPLLNWFISYSWIPKYIVARLLKTGKNATRKIYNTNTSYNKKLYPKCQGSKVEILCLGQKQGWTETIPIFVSPFFSWWCIVIKIKQKNNFQGPLATGQL